MEDDEVKLQIGQFKALFLVDVEEVDDEENLKVH